MQLMAQIWNIRFNRDDDVKFPFDKRYIMTVYLALDLGQLINWLALSIFVFKMETVRNRLTSSSFKIFKEKEKINQIIKIICISFLVIYCVFILIIETIDIIDIEKKIEEENLLVKILDDAFRILKFIQDLYLYFLFIRAFMYFFKQKTQNVGKVSKFNIRILCMTLALMIMSFSHSFIAFL